MKWFGKSIQGSVAGNKVSHPENYFYQSCMDADRSFFVPAKCIWRG